jgi:hypothetical protein
MRKNQSTHIDSCELARRETIGGWVGEEQANRRKAGFVVWLVVPRKWFKTELHAGAAGTQV